MTSTETNQVYQPVRRCQQFHEIRKGILDSKSFPGIFARNEHKTLLRDTTNKATIQRDMALTKSNGRFEEGITAKVMTMSKIIGMSSQQFRISLASRIRDRLGTESITIPSPSSPTSFPAASVILLFFRSILCWSKFEPECARCWSSDKNVELSLASKMSPRNALTWYDNIYILVVWYQKSVPSWYSC